MIWRYNVNRFNTEILYTCRYKYNYYNVYLFWNLIEISAQEREVWYLIPLKGVLSDVSTQVNLISIYRSMKTVDFVFVNIDFLYKHKESREHWLYLGYDTSYYVLQKWSKCITSLILIRFIHSVEMKHYQSYRIRTYNFSAVIPKIWFIF